MNEVLGDARQILLEHDAVHATWTGSGPGRDGGGRVHYEHHDGLRVKGTLTVKLEDGEVAGARGKIS